MLRLSLPTKPYWINLSNGVKLQVRPLNTAIYEAAKVKGFRLAAQATQEHGNVTEAGGEVSGLPDLDDEDGRQGLSQFLFTVALAQSAVIAWKGVLPPKGKRALKISPEGLRALMSVNTMAEDFLIEYTRPHKEMISEGNG